MKKVWIVVIAIVFLLSLWFVKNHYETRVLKKYEKENSTLRLLAERRELQYKIALYESKLNIQVARPAPPPVFPVPDPNE